MSVVNKGSIFVEELALLARVGVTAEERGFPQRIVLSLELTVDRAEGWGAVSLGETVDYSHVVTLVRERAAGGEWVLIEHLGVALGDGLLAAFPAVHEVRVTVKKFVFAEARSAGISCIVARE